MNNKVIKYIFSIILVFACLILFQTISQAASFSASISKTTVTVGDTFTVTVKANNAAGMYSVTNSNSNVSLSSGSKSEFLENNSKTVKFKANKAGNVTITAKAVDMTDLDNSSKKVTGSKTFNVTVKAKSSSSGNSGGSSSSENTTKPTFTSTNKKVYAKDSINLRSSWSTSSSATPVAKGTEMTLTGTSSKSVNGYVWYRVSYNGSTKYVASSLVTTTKPSSTSDKKEEEDNKDDKKDDSKATSTNLKSLVVTPTGLSPVFAAGTTEYTMTVGSNIDEIDVNAVAEDANASVKVTGNTDLKIGTNKITITVTAGEETKTYNITVTKEDKKQLQLSELLVEGLPLQPEFDSNIYEYTLTLDRSDVSEINITATPSKESAEVEIVGNTDLQVGENVVTILVKSANGEDITTYQITVTIPEAQEVVEEDSNKDLYLYIGIGVGALVILIIIIAIVKKHHNKDDDNMYYGMYHPNGNDEKKENKDFEDLNKDSKIEDNHLNELPELDNEDLPKSLRKNLLKKEDNPSIGVKVEEKIETATNVDSEMKSDRSKKIDEFYNTEDIVKPSRRGKHSK